MMNQPIRMKTTFHFTPAAHISGGMAKMSFALTVTPYTTQHDTT